MSKRPMFVKIVYCSYLLKRVSFSACFNPFPPFISMYIRSQTRSVFSFPLNIFIKNYTTCSHGTICEESIYIIAILLLAKSMRGN